MKSRKEPIRKHSNRNLFWTKIFFFSDDETKSTEILTCASREYLEDIYKISGSRKLSEEYLDKWLDGVATKWSKFGDEIFNQERHYDVYSNTQKGEANGIDFLLSIS